jgi:hypothetical protein
MVQVTTIASATWIFLVLERMLTARNHLKADEWYFRAGLPKICQIAIGLLLGIVVFLLHTPDLRAQARAPQGQSGAQKEDAAMQAAMPPDVVIVPDGTPLTLKVETDFSSATAKVGDTVEFTTPYPARVNGLVIVPKGTPVSGTVVEVRTARRASRDGEVKIAIGKLSLPSGDTATLRQAMKSESSAKRHGTGALAVIALVASSPFTAGILPAGVLFSKGDETVYRAGTWKTIYFDGPLSLNRGALANLQPPPYKGPPQVFFKNQRGRSVKLFSDQEYVGELFYPVRLELTPGTHSFSTGKAKEQAVQIEVHEDHQYWVERERVGLFAKDSQQHRDEIEELESAPWVTDRNFSLETPAYKGAAQINFVNRGKDVKLFCGQKVLTDSSHPLRIELNPGTYTFSTGKAKEQAAQIEVQEDHQYWIEIDRGGLFIRDFQQLHDDFKRLVPQVDDLDLTLPSTRDFCVPAGLP